MNALSILFNTDRFNLSKVGEHFINPCCFGEDLAGWLRQALIKHGIDALNFYQEDWGWELPVRYEDRTYYLCMSGNSDGLPESADRGEWRIIVEKKRSISERLRSKGQIRTNEPILHFLTSMLNQEPGFRNVRIED